MPQPRVRLDPDLKTAVAASVADVATKTDDAAPAVMLDRFVVRSARFTYFGPWREPPPEGKFTPLRGGNFVSRDFGKARLEVGIWPWFDLLADDAKFKPPRPSANLTFVRLSW